MKRKAFSRGTAEQMLQAFENKINELGGTSIEESTSVEAARYIDTQGVFGEPGSSVTEEELREYWDNEKDNDPVLQEYDSCDTWVRETLGWMEIADSVDSCNMNCCTDNGELYGADIDDEESDEVLGAIDPSDEESMGQYAEAVIDAVKEAFNESVDSVEGRHEGAYIYITVANEGQVDEYEVPLSDLSCDFDHVDSDADFIVDEILEGDFGPEEE